MKPVVKGVVIGCSVLLVLGAAAAVAIGWLLKSKSRDFVAKGKAMRSEGAQFGRDLSESQCLAEAMARYRKSTGMVSGIRQAVWLGACLETSAIDTGFCANVPPEDELVRTVAWRVARCADLGFSGDSTCPNILAEVQRYCGGAVRKKKISGSP